MKKIMSLLIVLLIVAVVAVSGCVTVNISTDDNTDNVNPTTKDMIKDSNSNNTIKNTTKNNTASKAVKNNTTKSDAKKDTADSKKSETKIYSSDEAGAFIEMEYNGVKVYVRDHYPYYSPQAGKVYYSAQEEAKDLASMAADFN